MKTLIHLSSKVLFVFSVLLLSATDSPAQTLKSGATVTAAVYSSDYAGLPTANAERYDPAKMTAAHVSLPAGSLVQLVNRANNKTVIVRINDRANREEGHPLVISQAAATALGVAANSTPSLWMMVTQLPPGSTWAEVNGSVAPSNVPIARTGRYSLQVGAFGNLQNAERLQLKFSNAWIQTIQRDSGLLYKVLVGRYSTLAEAEAERARIVAGGLEAVVVTT